MSKEEDRLFFRNFALTIALLSVMMIVFLVTARSCGIDHEAQLRQREQTLLERTAPVGQVVTSEKTGAKKTGAAATGAAKTGAGEPGPAEQDAGAGQAVSLPEAPAEAAQPVMAADGAMPDGEAIYNQLCIACHAVQGLGAPIVGDTEQWAARIAQGKEMLYTRAINGYTGPEGYMMPPRGGGQLSDEEVKAAVDYMVASSQ